LESSVQQACSRQPGGDMIVFLPRFGNQPDGSAAAPAR